MILLRRSMKIEVKNVARYAVKSHDVGNLKGYR